MTGTPERPDLLDRPAARRRAVLERAAAVVAGDHDHRAASVLAVLDEEFGPAALHVATPDGFALAAGSGPAAADPLLVERVAAQHRAGVGDGPLGAGTSLACPVLAGGRVVAVVAVTAAGGWRPSAAALAEGVVTIGTAAFVAEQDRVLAAIACVPVAPDDALVHDDAVQLLVAVAERLELVRTGLLPAAELVGLRTELLRAAARLAGPAHVAAGAGW